MSSPELEPPANQAEMSPDPFSPKKVYINTPGGMALHVLATAEQYSNPSIPQLDVGSLKIGDRLQVEIDGQEPYDYAVEDTVITSMAFGAEDILSPRLSLMFATGERAGDRVQFTGSSISPWGTLLSPGIVKVGTYFNIASQEGTEISKGVVTGFSVKRQTEDGRYVEVPLNHQEMTSQESQSYADLERDYADVVGVLSDKGFRFDDLDEDGLPQIYKKVNDQGLVYASNQGFGCGVIPQHEAYMFSADKQQLIGMRYLPTKRIAQMVVMQGLSPELFAQETVAYDVNGELDWREARYIGASCLHRMAPQVPFITYTWLNGSIEKPTITVIANAGVEGMQQMQDETYYAVDITQEEEPSLSAAETQWWVDNPEEYKALEVNNTTLSEDNIDGYDLSFADLLVKIAKDPSVFRAELIESFRQS